MVFPCCLWTLLWHVLVYCTIPQKIGCYEAVKYQSFLGKPRSLSRLNARNQMQTAGFRPRSAVKGSGAPYSDLLSSQVSTLMHEPQMHAPRYASAVKAGGNPVIREQVKLVPVLHLQPTPSPAQSPVIKFGCFLQFRFQLRSLWREWPVESELTCDGSSWDESCNYTLSLWLWISAGWSRVFWLWAFLSTWFQHAYRHWPEYRLQPQNQFLLPSVQPYFSRCPCSCWPKQECWGTVPLYGDEMQHVTYKFSSVGDRQLQVIKDSPFCLKTADIECT
ncbi:hypothetical protein GJAV_G00228870 [Gymnothorax javanicus]|nr:hypothetical protein GJAV_G00228870 [Gymnothorax javanicus]